jgi:putative flippase GtrA
MVIGSRYVRGGEVIGWELRRKVVSRVACLLALPITSIKDATSGFFAFRKNLIEGVKLEPSSWKIMLEVLLKTKPTRVLELPIQFEVRRKGKSKFNRKQMIAYLKHLALLAFWKYQRFIKFCVVGGVGAIITFGITWLGTEIARLWYMFSLVIAVLITTVSNFTLNSLWTFKLTEDPEAADYDWRSFYKGNLVQKWWKQSIAKTVWDWIPNTSRLVDIGCGSSPIICNYTGALGIDKNRSKLEFMKEKSPSNHFTTKETSVLASNTFDYALCVEMLEHLAEPEKLVAEIARVLKGDGKVVIATPDYSKWLWLLAEKFTPYKEEHIYRFTRESLEALCKKYGLVPTKHRYVATCDLIEMFEKTGG